MNGEKAFKKFFKGKSGFPKFKKKKNQDVKAYFPKNNKTDWTIERHRIKPDEAVRAPDVISLTNGYSPFKQDYTTVFMAAGCGIKKGAVIEKMDLVDEGPIMAKLLGLELKNVDGRVIEEIFQ